MIKRAPSGMYVVPSDIILQTNPYLPAVYIAGMRFTNLRNEVVTSVALMLKYLSINPGDQPDGPNQQVRRALHRMKNMHVIHHTSFSSKKSAPPLNLAFMFAFGRGYGWEPAKHISAGYIKEPELEKMRQRAHRHSIGMLETVPKLIHMLLYCRMIMEKPAGVRSLATAEKQAMGLVLEKDIRDALGLNGKQILGMLRALQRLRIIDFRRRIVREKSWSPPMRLYVITNYFQGHMKLLEKGLNSAAKIFASCEFIEDTEVPEDAFTVTAKEERKEGLAAVRELCAELDEE